MKKITTSLAVFLIFAIFLSANAQVRTNLNNVEKISTKGKFNKTTKTEVDLNIPKKDIKELLEKEKKEYTSTNEDKPFRLATAIPVDIDIAKQANWTFEKEFAYGNFSIRLNGALSASINFDKFYLPPNSEMYIYNENGNMITGPITEKENNPNNVWGSWVYKGEYLTIEIKTPITSFKELAIHSNNIAYGYKHVYQSETAGFGNSEPCNINVICPLGTGWEAERNSVALVLNDNGQDWCSGAMVMNTCNTNRPFFLTANHCFTGQNVTAWRFMFQAWSPTCPNPGINNDGVTYNGSTLRANWDGTDFCLVELNNTPPANSGINYAGWNRNTNGITQSTIIHHPQGDVMKISRDNQAPVFDNFSGAQCWRLGLDQGATQGGSSGSPYFDQNRRIIGQHFGIDDGNLPVCDRSRKFGGRFDLSWTGGGTNATRLSNWLDPANTNQLTTNTTNGSILTNFNPNLSISGPTIICSTAQYLIPNLPNGATVIWSIQSSAGPVLQLSPDTPIPNHLRITNQRWYSVSTTLTALISNLGCGVPNQTITKIITNDNSTSASVPYSYYQEACTFYNVYHPSQSGTVTSNSSPVFVHQGCMVYVNLGDMTGRTVTLGGGGTPLLWGVGSTSYYPNTLYFKLPLGSGGIPFTFNITGDGACYSRSLLFFSYNNNSRYAYAASPNPANNQLTLTVKENEEYVVNSNEKTRSDNSKTTLNIFDMNTSKLYFSQQVLSGSGQHTLNISSLRPGYYVLQVINGEDIQSIKFKKE